MQHIRLRLIGGFVLLPVLFDFAKWFRTISDIYCCYGGFDFRRNSGIAGSFNLCTLFTPLAQQGRYQDRFRALRQRAEHWGPLLGAMVIEVRKVIGCCLSVPPVLILLAVLGFAFTVRESIPALNDPLHPAAH